MTAKTALVSLIKQKGLRSPVVALQQSPSTAAARLSTKTSTSSSSAAAAASVVGSVNLRAVNVSSLKQPRKLRTILPATVQTQGGRPPVFFCLLIYAVHYFIFKLWG